MADPPSPGSPAIKISIESAGKEPPGNKSDIDVNTPGDGNKAVKTEGQMETLSEEPSGTDRPPLRICAFIVGRPKLSLGVTLGCHIFLLVLTFALLLAGYDIFPVDFQNVPLQLNEDDSYLRVQAWRHRNDDKTILANLEDSQTVDERSETTDVIQLIVESNNIFTKEKLKALDSLEKSFMETSGYEDYCQLTNTGQCQPPNSVLRFFDGTIPGLYDPNYDNICEVFLAVQVSPELSPVLNVYIGKDFRIDNNTNTVYGSITRTFILLGGPLKGYNNSNDDSGKQWDQIRDDFVVKKLRKRLYDLVSNGYYGMDIVFYSNMLFNSDAAAQVVTDLLLAAGSFCFIFITILFQTQSFMVSSLAVFSILTSFTGANLIYRIIFDFRYFGIFHVLSVFIILGIGADDIFVFYDTWRGTGHVTYPSLAHRLSDCYRRAAMAMLITSLTTMIAFIANAFSPLLAISSFGLFSGILVFVNYLSVISFFPCVVVVHHLYWANWSWPFFRKCCKQKTAIMGKVTDSRQELNKHDSEQTSKNLVVRFFIGPYFKFVTHRISRWCILVVFVGVMTCFIYFATRLTSNEEALKIFKSDHNYERAASKADKKFMPSEEDNSVKVYLVWGLKTQDRSSCHRTDFIGCTGKTVWENGFDLNPKPAQVALQNLCEKIRQMSREESEKLHIRRNSVSGLPEVECFLDEMDSYLKEEAYNRSGLDFSLPATEMSMTKFMEAYPDFYNISTLPKNFYRFFETAVSFWETAGYTAVISPEAREYSEYLGQAHDPFNTVYLSVNSTEHRFGTRLRYASIVINTDITEGNLGYQTGLPIHDAWEAFTQNEMSLLPPSVSDGFQCTPEGMNLWHWIKVQKMLASNAVQGIIVGISLAFPVLVLATQNIIIGFLATVTIGCTTVSVVGIIPMAGWKLGVLESLNLSLVVGLAVDYVVHLAEGYHLSKCSDRGGRVRDMLEHVGVSVISGACTTLGASVFLLFAQILFFMQFALFIFCTIGFSLVFSLCVFTTVMGMIGPQGEFGSIKPVFIWIRNKSTGRKPDDVKCKTCAGKGFHCL